MPSKEKGSLCAISQHVSGHMCFPSCVDFLFLAKTCVFFDDSSRKMKIDLAWEDEKN